MDVCFVDTTFRDRSQSPWSSGMRCSRPEHGALNLGGKRTGTTTSLVDESAIRGMYDHCREAMEL